MMQDNPFSGIINIFRNDADGRSVAPWIIGKINTVSPLTIIVNGQVVSTGVYANSLLLGRTCSINLKNSGLQDAADLGGVLAIDDEVVLLQSGDGQRYVILCKVVSG